MAQDQENNEERTGRDGNDRDRPPAELPCTARAIANGTGGSVALLETGT